MLSGCRQGSNEANPALALWENRETLIAGVQRPIDSELPRSLARALEQPNFQLDWG